MAKHGGARPGAGRPAGAANRKTREIADRAASEGITPLEYMLSVLRDEENDSGVRMEAAKSAAPYMHPRLTNVDAKVDAHVALKQLYSAIVGGSDPLVGPDGADSEEPE